MKKTAGTLLIFLLLTSFYGAAQVPITKVDWEAFMAKQALKWDNISTDYYSGVILGNGLLGTNIYKKSDSAIRFDIGRSDVVDQRGDLYPNLGNLYTKARLPIGYFSVKTSGKIIGADITLDIYNAEAKGTISTSKGQIKFSALVPATQNVIRIVLDATDGEPSVILNWNPGRSISPRLLQSYPTDKPADFPDNPPVKKTMQNGFQIYNQPLLNKGGYATAYKIAGTKNHSEVLVSVGYDGHNTLNENEEAVNSIKQFEKDNNAIASHKNWWHNYYKRSFVALPDKRMENFYWIQLYKLASVTRADKPMVDLVGPWTAPTPWPAIWWNLNTQLTYSPIFTANQLELGQSLFKTLQQNKQNLIDNVPQKWRYNSAAIGRSSSYDLVSPITEEHIKSGHFEPSNLVWTMFYYYQCYAYSKDERVLKDEVFPLLKRSTNFLIHLLTKDENGKYHFPMSHSPEYKDAEDANYTLASLHWALETLVKTNAQLHLGDPDVDKWNEILKNLTPYPIGESGFLIGKDVPLNSSHRHYSHLLMVYPYYLVNWEQKNNRDLIERSLHNWLSQKGAHAGYSFTGSSSIYSSMGNGDKAYESLNTLFDKYMQPNTLYKESGPVIETPLAAAASIQEMLLQSWGNKIRVFPAIPSSWKNITFKQWRAEGAFLIDADRQNDHTTFIQIESLAGGSCVLVTDMDNFSITSNKRKSFDYITTTEGGKTIIRIDSMAPTEVIQVRAKDYPQKTSAKVDYSLYENWSWGIQKNSKSK
ncbi:glycosyl hydrolase family 95 catalytic domain-containing protein [Pedobacter endophyticus]|uniref:Alpha-L-fucosidase n=1 Tax=Pedobacter endophyticus TaxID=2789740 RepID=A0A7S9KY57_9SPHI|nr:alpha-L-fucosidase [Pedobacter endophyticus]QPH38986.1 alpha-L-fucosidase [Pedobacter endophyticus]